MCIRASGPKAGAVPAISRGSTCFDLPGDAGVRRYGCSMVLLPVSCRQEARWRVAFKATLVAGLRARSGTYPQEVRDRTDVSVKGGMIMSMTVLAIGLGHAVFPVAGALAKGRTGLWVGAGIGCLVALVAGGARYGVIDLIGVGLGLAAGLAMLKEGKA